MASSLHNKDLAQYLKGYKIQDRNKSTSKIRTPSDEHRSPETKRLGTTKKENAFQSSRPPENSTFGGARPKTSPKHRTNKILENKLAVMKASKPTMECMPDEILLQIFSHLQPNNVLVSARVCKRWLALTNDNMLWRKIHSKYSNKVVGKKAKAMKIPTNPPASFWKSQCIHNGADYRNSKTIPLLKKLNPFTGLPANTSKAIQQSGAKWQICLVDTNDSEYIVTHNDAFYFSMSVCCRWYNFTEAPILGHVKRLQLYSINPVFFDEKGKAVANSPCQRSILYSSALKWNQFKDSNRPIGSDDTVDLYALPDSIFIATWKDGGEIAFISASFHAHLLVQRCLMGSSSVPYFPPPRKISGSDIDPKYGLHSYSCTLELRNQRTSFWSERFSNLFCQPEFRGGHAYIQLIDPDQSYQRSWVDRKISFPWKTDVLKGIIKGVAVMDVTVLDDANSPMWCACGPVQVTTPGSSKVDYEYDGDYYQLHYSDSFGKVEAALIWEEENNKYYMTSLSMAISLTCINSWFGTRY